MDKEAGLAVVMGRLTDSRQTISSDTSNNPPVTQVAMPLNIQNFKTFI